MRLLQLPSHPMQDCSLKESGFPKKVPSYTLLFLRLRIYVCICMKLLKREFLYSTVYIERDCLESKADLWTLSLQSLLQHMQGSGATTAATRARSCQVKDHTIYICMGLTLWLQRLFGLESPNICIWDLHLGLMLLLYGTYLTLWSGLSFVGWVF